jgi:uncharacterized FAD-dependent dehydrogenase
MRYRLPVPLTANTATRPVVVGFGPCGMFAALLLAQMGFRPIVLERGRPVRERTKDTWGLWRKKVLDPESNVQFGEGGAGTFSDGKLWSQIKDPRFLGRKVMEEFVLAGAPPEILYEAHPHIGTFKLVKVVESLRAQIIALGGEVRFGQRVVDLVYQHETEQAHANGALAGTTGGQPQAPGPVADAPGGTSGSVDGMHELAGLQVLDVASSQTQTIAASHVVMALGHSARDTFAMLYERGVEMQAKPFSIGFRIEHPQGVIDRARWGRHAGHPMLGAADYKLIHHASNGRAVYSFCMCPGGTVVAATSEPGRVVTNGMSQYSRNERNANAGIVVGIDPVDYPQDEASFLLAFGESKGRQYAQEAAVLKGATAPSTAGPGRASDHDATLPTQAQKVHPLAGIALQRALESGAYMLGGNSYEAPGQRLGDFLVGRPSSGWGTVLPSYRPGVRPTDLAPSLPAFAIDAIREALPVFGRKIRGFDMADAVLTGVETRTSSPLKIPRGEDLQSTNVRGLFPAGEGASYAGGILSAGVDGIRVAEAVAASLSLQGQTGGGRSN